MTLQLVREHCYPDRVEGRLSEEGVFLCYSLEPPRRADNPLIEHPAIPAGRYGVSIGWSPRFKMNTPHINGVPGRSNILIHPLNQASESLGCIGVGTQRSETGILHSREAFHNLMIALAQVLTKDKPVWLEIEDPLKVERRA